MSEISERALLLAEELMGTWPPKVSIQTASELIQSAIDAAVEEAVKEEREKVREKARELIEKWCQSETGGRADTFISLLRVVEETKVAFGLEEST